MTKIEISSKIWLKSKLFENFEQNRNFSKIRPKSKFFCKFDEDHNFGTFDQNWNFCQNLTIIKKSSKQSEFFENFDQNRIFPKIFSNIDMFWKFGTKSKIFDILNKFEIFGNFRRIWPKSKFFRKIWPKPKLWKIWLNWKLLKLSKKIKFIRNLTKFQIFSKIWLKSKFFEKFDRNRHFSNYRKKSQFFRKFD